MKWLDKLEKAQNSKELTTGVNQLDEIAITGKTSNLARLQAQYQKENPFKAIENPYLAKHKPSRLEGMNLIEREAYDQNQAAWTAEQLEKGSPREGQDRVDWLNTFTLDEQSVLGTQARNQPSLWTDTKQGIKTIGSGLSGTSMAAVMDKKSYSAQENIDRLQQYSDSPVLSFLGDAAKIASPLAVPGKVVQSIYRDNYSLGDALSGTKNDATFVEDMLTDIPADLATGYALKGLSSAARGLKGLKALNKANVSDTARLVDDLDDWVPEVKTVSDSKIAEINKKNLKELAEKKQVSAAAEQEAINETSELGELESIKDARDIFTKSDDWSETTKYGLEGLSTEEGLEIRSAAEHLIGPGGSATPNQLLEMRRISDLFKKTYNRVPDAKDLGMFFKLNNQNKQFSKGLGKMNVRSQVPDAFVFRQKNQISTDYTPEEEFLIDAYTEGYDSRINNRGAYNLPLYTEEVANKLEDLVLKNKLKEEQRLLRGTSDFYLNKVWREGEPLGYDIRYSDLKEGDEFEPGGFLSTALPEKKGGKFSHWGDAQLTTEITAPPGQSVLYPNALERGNFPHEREVILPKKLRYKLDKRTDPTTPQAKALENKFVEENYIVEDGFYYDPKTGKQQSALDIKKAFVDSQESAPYKLSIMNPYMWATGLMLGSQVGKRQQGGIVKDNQGYWNPKNHGKVVEIDSNDITMRGVNQPLLGISDTGDSKMMYPGRDYKFKGNKVREYPMAQDGREYSFEEIPTQDKKKIVIDDYSMFYDYMVEGDKVYSKSKKGQKWKDISDNKKAQNNLFTFLDKNNYWAGYGSGEKDLFMGKTPAQPYQPKTGAPMAYEPTPEPFTPSEEHPWDINQLFQETAPEPLTDTQKADIKQDVMSKFSKPVQEQIAPEGDIDKGIFSGLQDIIKGAKKKRAEIAYNVMDEISNSSIGETFKDADDLDEFVEIVSNGIQRKWALNTGKTDDVEVKEDAPVEDLVPKSAKEYYGTPDKGRVYATIDAPKTDGRVFKQQTLPTSKITFGARNRGDLTEFETDGMEITSFNPFVAKAYPPNQTVIALDPEGNVHAGVAGDFAGKEKEGWTFSHTFRNNIVDFPEKNGKSMYKPSVKNPGFQQPLVDVQKDDGTFGKGSLNILVKGSNDKYYGSVQGGRVLLQDPTTKEIHLVSGNLEHIKKEFRRLKKDSPYLTAYSLDNGTYSRGLSYKDKKMTSERLTSYDRENAGGGGNALYIKGYKQPVSQFNETIVDNMPNVRTEKDQSYKSGHALKNEAKKIILHHTAYENEAANSAQVNKQFMTPNNASAHVVIEEDGSRTIYASPEQVTFHAGSSSWEGRGNVNDFGIGVEFQGNTVKKPLSKAQIESFIEYYKPIAEKYGLSLKDILTHEMIAPGRKPDVKVQEYQKIMNAMREHNLK